MPILKIFVCPFVLFHLAIVLTRPGFEPTQGMHANTYTIDMVT
jgi:hypothetical protein